MAAKVQINAMIILIHIKFLATNLNDFDLLRCIEKLESRPSDTNNEVAVYKVRNNSTIPYSSEDKVLANIGLRENNINFERISAPNIYEKFFIFRLLI
tara:strand:+ start:28 stop:321 length:294 start_codon:yes stop_codon:yes gene_type:complete